VTTKRTHHLHAVPLVLNLPMGQCVQAETLVDRSGLAFPAAQFEHLVDPNTGENFPPATTSHGQ
jgi:hypothetical protein